MRADLCWTPERQTFRFGAETFAHEGRVLTHPSHDLCHLIVAASSDLGWRPVGADDARREAEYNAYVLEHVLERAAKGERVRSLVTDAIPSLRHFVDVYYAPFRLTAEELFARWCRRTRLRDVLALAPCYLGMRLAELADPGYRERAWRVELAAVPATGRVAAALALAARDLAEVLA